MIARRPFADGTASLEAARVEWFALGREDWLEAFSHHPKIGDVESLRGRFPATHELSTREQAAVLDASDSTLAALADANRAYEEKFGYIFIVCASDRTAEEMLAFLRARLSNDPGTEIRIAAEEQARITALRLKQA
jgi:2-oxo-4-hydroxy-4-carboxy-5-ureidoimidazoline decarboxylase